MKVAPNALYYGDCLDVMRGWPDEIVDLCYLDPPFNSKSNYNILFGDKRGPDRQQVLAFEDTWHWDEAAADRTGAFERAVGNPAYAAISGLHTVLGNCGMMAYLSYMAERLIEIRRTLKNTGSIYLHCDPTASHYLKIVMDAIFGQSNFRNEIVWCYRKMPNKVQAFQRNHDVLLYYSKTENYCFNVVEGKMTEGSKRTFESGKRKGYNANNSKKMVTVFDWDKYHEAVRIGKIPDDLKAVEFKGGNPPEKDWWGDIKILGGPYNKEKVGYPTQKPIALLQRIIDASSNRGDLVLDPFCGCGTTIDAASRRGRKWLGIDISPFAIDLVKHRRLQDASIPVYGIPVDVETARAMARSKPFDFEKWAVTRIPGIMPNRRQVGDGGIDGRGKVLETSGLVLAQVKGGKFVRGQLRDFLHTVHREKATLGIYITVDRVTSASALAEAREAGYFTLGANDYPKVQLWSMVDFFDHRKPDLPSLADPFTGKPMQSDMLRDRDQAML